MANRGGIRRYALLSAAAWAICASSGSAAWAESSPRISDVKVGFEGLYKLGTWTAVSVVVEAGDRTQSGNLEITTADDDGVPCIYPTVPVQLVAGRSTTATTYVRFGEAAPTLSIKLRTEHGTALQETIRSDSGKGRPQIPAPLAADAKLVVCIGRSTTLESLAGEALPGAGGFKLHVAQVDDVRSLPDRPPAYDGVDAVFISADKRERFAAWTADAAPALALKHYLEFGGQLFFAAGDDARELLPAGAPLAKIAPLRIGDLVPLPRSTALEEYVGGNKPLRGTAAALGQVRIPRAEPGEGIVELSEGDLPLVVRRAVGFGVATWVLVDLEHPLLSAWSGRGPLLVKIMAAALRVQVDTGALNSAPPTLQSGFGFADLAGQLCQAVDQYEGVRVIPFYVLALMLLAYMGLIGPLDYWLVRKVLGKPELTWLSIPVMILAAVTATYATAVWLKGNELRVHQAEVIDCDAALGIVRGTAFSGVFSPVTELYDARFEMPADLFDVGLEPAQVTTTWLGMPGDGLSGMHRRNIGREWTSRPYRTDDEFRAVTGLPIKIWSSKLLYGRWEARSTAPLHEKLREDDDGDLVGAFRNPFKATLNDALLCYGSKAYKLQSLSPGDVRDLAVVESRDLQSLLTNAEIVGRSQREMSPGVRTRPHDIASLDAAEVLNKMLFYQAAGGESHARLRNDDQSRLDLSRLLHLRRAVLVARVADAASLVGGRLELRVDGRELTGDRDTRQALVRLVIPVEKSAK